MSRAKWKGPYFDPTVYNRFYKNKVQSDRIWSRESVIPAFWIGKSAYIHNGLTFKRIFVLRENVGLKFGLFAKTRKHTYKVKKLNKKLKQKK